MNTLMLSCLKATELMEYKAFMPLSVGRNMQLQMHIAMCPGCKNYQEQSRLIDKLLHKNLHSFPALLNTAELEASIIAKL